MTYTDFSEIDKLHSEWSMMDNAAKLGLLMGEKMRLNRLANQLALSTKANGGFMNDAVRTYARKLLEMIDFVDVEGQKMISDLSHEALKDMVRSLMK